jgi:hypothetical protein
MKKIAIITEDICSLPEKELKSQVLFCSLVPPIVGVNSGPGTLIVGFYYC